MLTDDQIKTMVDRFLAWKLPADFAPDAGIKFDPVFNKGTPYEMRHEPMGTNLFHAGQAEAMVRHMVEGIATAPREQPSDDLVNRLTEIANRDSAKSVTVRADDLRALLTRYGAAPQGVEDAQPDDECLALDLLETLFDAWENGIACYEDPESNGAFLGNAFRLDDDTVNACASLLNRRRPRDGATPQPAPQAAPAEELAAARQEIERLNSIINTPQADDFLRAVSTEAEHQRQRWGSEHDAGKAPADWFWLLGYLGGKALHAHSNDNMEKAEHHIITTAAVCANWHRAMFGKTDMRPGIDGEAALTTQGADHG